jgi:hypothetical protein
LVFECFEAAAEEGDHGVDAGGELLGAVRFAV